MIDLKRNLYNAEIERLNRLNEEALIKIKKNRAKIKKNNERIKKIKRLAEI